MLEPATTSARSTTRWRRTCRRSCGWPTWPTSSCTRRCRWPRDDRRSRRCWCSTSTRARRPRCVRVRAGRRSGCATCSTQLGLEACVKTSGSKGLQVYVPLNADVTYDRHKPFAQAVAAAAGEAAPRARGLEHGQGAAQGEGARRLEPERRAQDDGQRVLAARARTPDGLDAGGLGGGRAGGRGPATPTRSCSTSDEVLDRVQRLGDLFAPVLEREQELPALSG